MPGSDSNPYLVAAGVLAAGLAGIERKIEPGEPVVGSAYQQKTPSALAFPNSFGQAIERFHKSTHAREWFGDDFVEMFAGTRRAQADAFARMVSNRELQRFLELA